MKAERARNAIPPLLKLIWRLRLEIVADFVLSPRSVYLSQLDEQVQNNQPLTVTLPEMTRFLLSLHRAVDTVFSSISRGNRGETFVPQVSSAKMIDVAKALMGEKELEIKFTGIRPGEKVHEIMVSEEECFRTVERGDYYVILPVLPELRGEEDFTQALQKEYSSVDNNLPIPELRSLLQEANPEIALFI